MAAAETGRSSNFEGFADSRFVSRLNVEFSVDYARVNGSYPYPTYPRDLRSSNYSRFRWPPSGFRCRSMSVAVVCYCSELSELQNTWFASVPKIIKFYGCIQLLQAKNKNCPRLIWPNFYVRQILDYNCVTGT